MTNALADDAANRPTASALAYGLDKKADEIAVGEAQHPFGLDDRLRVTPSPALYGDLKAILGPSCLG